MYDVKQGMHKKRGKRQNLKKIEIPALLSCEQGNPEQETYLFLNFTLFFATRFPLS